MRLTTPLKTHGGKHYLASKIVELMPPHLHYVEPFFGGGSVLLTKDPNGVSEVANDLNGRLMNFWRVMQDEDLFARFQRILQATPFSEVAWRDAHQRLRADGDVVQDAAAFFIECRQSLAGRGDTFAPLSKTRTRRGMNEQASAWMNAVDGLATVHQRLHRVVVLDRPAMEVIRQQDGPDTLYYLDPPYPQTTRTATQTYGEYEMADTDHSALLELINSLRGRVMISGYHCDLYDDVLAKWHCHEFELPNNAAGGKNKRRMVECVWCNFEPELEPLN